MFTLWYFLFKNALFLVLIIIFYVNIVTISDYNFSDSHMIKNSFKGMSDHPFAKILFEGNFIGQINVTLSTVTNVTK